MYKTITTNIMVKNVKETISFYEKKLGFKKMLSVPETGEKLYFAIINRDAITIMFQEKENLQEEYPILTTENIKATFTLYITVENVNELYDILKNKVKLAKELHKTFYGKDEFAIFDNNNNILTISS